MIHEHVDNIFKEVWLLGREEAAAHLVNSLLELWDVVIVILGTVSVGRNRGHLALADRCVAPTLVPWWSPFFHCSSSPPTPPPSNVYNPLHQQITFLFSGPPTRCTAKARCEPGTYAAHGVTTNLKKESAHPDNHVYVQPFLLWTTHMRVAHISSTAIPQGGLDQVRSSWGCYGGDPCVELPDILQKAANSLPLHDIFLSEVSHLTRAISSHSTLKGRRGGHCYQENSISLPGKKKVALAHSLKSLFWNINLREGIEQMFQGGKCTHRPPLCWQPCRYHGLYPNWLLLMLKYCKIC